MTVQVFTDLKIWQKARAWSKTIFFDTKESPFCEDRRLVAQINDSSESVGANIAEGFGRGTQGEFITFLGYSIGSINETQSHLCAAYDREYLSRERFAELFAQGTEIRKMTTSFIQSMVMPGAGVKSIKKVPSWSEQVWELYERTTGRERPEFFRKHKPAGK
jgi:four helix bundle protein